MGFKFVSFRRCLFIPLRVNVYTSNLAVFSALYTETFSNDQKSLLASSWFVIHFCSGAYFINRLRRGIFKIFLPLQMIPLKAVKAKARFFQIETWVRFIRSKGYNHVISVHQSTTVAKIFILIPRVLRAQRWVSNFFIYDTLSMFLWRLIRRPEAIIIKDIRLTRLHSLSSDSTPKHRSYSSELSLGSFIWCKSLVHTGYLGRIPGRN